MTLSEQLNNKLSMIEGQSWPDAGQTLLVNADGRHLECRIERCEQIACTLWSLQLDGASGALSADERTELGQKIVDEVTYLPEALTVVESCDDGTILRSVDPPSSDDGVEYLELTISPAGMLVLQAYTGKSGTPRQTRTFGLTRDILSRLVADLERITS